MRFYLLALAFILHFVSYSQFQNSISVMECEMWEKKLFNVSNPKKMCELNCGLKRFFKPAQRVHDKRILMHRKHKSLNNYFLNDGKHYELKLELLASYSINFANLNEAEDRLIDVQILLENLYQQIVVDYENLSKKQQLSEVQWQQLLWLRETLKKIILTYAIKDQELSENISFFDSLQDDSDKQDASAEVIPLLDLKDKLVATISQLNLLQMERKQKANELDLKIKSLNSWIESHKDTYNKNKVSRDQVRANIKDSLRQTQVYKSRYIKECKR